MSSQPTRRVGVVGAGGMATTHATSWVELGVEVVVHSTSDAPQLAASVGGRAVETLDELLADCDVVDVCTPTPVHPQIVLAAAEAGRPVICEKPLALTAMEAAEMLEACERAGVPLYPAHVVRWFDAYAAMQAAVAAGAVGDVAVQRFTRTGSRPDQAWFADDGQSGGLVSDQSIHDLDFARWTAGEVVAVYAQEARHEGTAGAVRSVQVSLTHAGGAISYVSGTWGRPGTAFRTTFEVAGSTGLLRHDSREHPELVVDAGVSPDDRAASRGLLPGLGFGESPYTAQLRELLTALDGGPPPRVSAVDGVRAVALAEAARMSLLTRNAVPVPDPWRVS